MCTNNWMMSDIRAVAETDATARRVARGIPTPGYDSEVIRKFLEGLSTAVGAKIWQAL
jgi:hypothetical protein